MSDKSFRFDWYPKEAHTDFMKLPAEEIGVLMQICNLMYLNNGPIEYDPKWIARSIGDMGSARCRNIIKSLIKKGHLNVDCDIENLDKIPAKLSKNMVKTQLKLVENRRKTKKKDDVFDADIEQNQGDNNSLETEEETVPVPAAVYSKVLEGMPSINPVYFSNFLEHRQKIGKPVHPNFIPNIIDDLKKLINQGEDPNLVIQQSIKNGWSSLQPTKKTERKKRNAKSNIGEQAQRAMDKYSDPKTDTDY